MAFGLMSKILGLFLIASRILPSAQIECASKINLKYGEMNEVSCEYPLSFLSVRWYRGRDSAPIARIEGGSKSVTQGYDITVRGNLQINQVDVSHAGIYNITVLDIDGHDDTKTMYAHVTAGLTENPILERCASTRLTLCSGVAELAKATTLICSAHNTLPAVGFKWYNLMNGQNQTLNSSSPHYIRNETSMLFSSYSTLSYKPDTFTLNIFTCKATGFAASRDALQSSILVEGTVPPRKTTQVVHPAQINTIVEFKCSDSAPLLARWKMVYPNGTVEALWDIYPGSTCGNCSSGTRCHVDHTATLTVYEIQKLDEAAYECVYYDGDHSGKTTVHLRVIVRPDPYRIVIQGCNDTLHCKLDVVTLQGTFNVSVNGARPSAELLCEVADESKAEVSAFNTERNIIEHVEMGTYDTEVIIHYDIKKCVERVHVVCQIPPNTVHENLFPLNIFLITEAAGCSDSNTGLVVGLIVGILFFVVAVSIMMHIILRKGNSKDTPHYSKAKTGNDVEFHPLEAHHEAQRETQNKAEHDSQNEEEEPLLMGDFDSFFNSFCFQVEETKEVPEKDVERLMKYFEKDGEPDQSLALLVNHITNTGQSEKILYIVLRFLAREKIHNEENAKIFCQLIEDLTENKKLSVGNFIKVCQSMIDKRKIPSGDFESAKLRLLQSDELNYNAKVIILTGDEDIVKKPYIYSLQSIYELYTKDQFDVNLLLNLLYNILKENVNNPELLVLNTTIQDNDKVQDEKVDQEIKQDETKSDGEDNKEISGEESQELVETKNSKKHLSETKDVTSVYIQGLLCSVLDNTINFEECGKLLESGINKGKTEILQYKNAYEASLKKKTNRDGKFWIRFIANLCNMNVIKEELKSSFILKIVNTFLMSQGEVRKTIDDMMSKSSRHEFLQGIEFKDDDIKKRKKKEKGKAENKMNETKK